MTGKNGDLYALDLETGVFTLNSPRKIASSLKRSAEQSHRRKSDPYRSAMSTLTTRDTVYCCLPLHHLSGTLVATCPGSSRPPSAP
jgi:hypothetical protein